MYNNLNLLVLIAVSLICSEGTLALNDEEPQYYKNCKEVYEGGHTRSSQYFIQPRHYPDPFLVFCNNASGGGWTTILRRFDGSQNFYQDWNSYKYGFGNLAGEFWLGLEKLYYMTKYESNELRFELVDWDGVQVEAYYNWFNIGNENENYTLKFVTGYSGTAGDCFTELAGVKFSTYDRDNDYSSYNYAVERQGGWWFNARASGNPTGKYGNCSGCDSTMYWDTFHPSHYSLKEVRMMFRSRRS